MDEFLERCSHALLVAGGVWIFDPVVPSADVERRLRELGEPRAVVTSLDRHARDGARLAERLGVAHHAVPLGGLPERAIEVLPVVRSRFWREALIWWPERRVLVAGDALGTAAYYRVGDEPLAVHPLLRWLPPRELQSLTPDHVLCGHGVGIHGSEAAPAVSRALATARRGIPRQLVSVARSLRRPVRRGP